MWLIRPEPQQCGFAFTSSAKSYEVVLSGQTKKLKKFVGQERKWIFYAARSVARVRALKGPCGGSGKSKAVSCWAANKKPSWWAGLKAWIRGDRRQGK